MQVLLTNVAHVPDLRYHLFSLPTLVKNGHTFEGRPTRVVVKLSKSVRSCLRSVVPLTVFTATGLTPVVGERPVLYSPRGNCPTSKGAIDINDFPCAARHPHEVLPRKTAEQQRIVLEGELLECTAWPMTEGLRKSIEQSTHTRAE